MHILNSISRTLTNRYILAEAKFTHIICLVYVAVREKGETEASDLITNVNCGEHINKPLCYTSASTPGRSFDVKSIIYIVLYYLQHPHQETH